MSLLAVFLGERDGEQARRLNDEADSDGFTLPAPAAVCSGRHVSRGQDALEIQRVRRHDGNRLARPSRRSPPQQLHGFRQGELLAGKTGDETAAVLIRRAAPFGGSPR